MASSLLDFLRPLRDQYCKESLKVPVQAKTVFFKNQIFAETFIYLWTEYLNFKNVGLQDTAFSFAGGK